MFNMDVSAITQIIGSLGFPIAAAVAMFWQLIKVNQQHKEEMDALKESLNSNTLALVELRDALRRDHEAGN